MRGLEALFCARYQARGLVVLGFPSNDFGSQEPGDAKQIADFVTYGACFPMLAKTEDWSETNAFYAKASAPSG